MDADMYICKALRDNGLLRQKEVFNKTKKKLHGMTLSELFCVLVVSVPTMRVIIMRCASEHIIQDCFKLLQKLQRLVALTYWWPVQELDGKKAVALVHEDKDAYFSDLKFMSKQYVQEVNKICGQSDDIRQQLDKPNLHRLIELYEHTIPAFGHVREVMELVFESAHQPLKRSITRSNNRNAHIFAVEHCVGNDWQGRIAALGKQIFHPDARTRTTAKRGLRRVLLGETADLLDEEKHSEQIKNIDTRLRSLFTPALKAQFQKDTMISNFGVAKISLWKARVKISNGDLCSHLNITQNEANEIVDTSRLWIDSLYPAIPQLKEETLDQEKVIITLFKNARRVRVSNSGRHIGKPSGHDTISANSCVQMYLDPINAESKILTSNPRAAQARPFFFAILAVLQRKQETPFAVCFKCTRRKDWVERRATVDNHSFQLILLTPDIRRIANYHICDRNAEEHAACRWDPRTGEVSHTKSLLLRGRFYFQARVHGYPLRIA